MSSVRFVFFPQERVLQKKRLTGKPYSVRIISGKLKEYHTVCAEVYSASERIDLLETFLCLCSYPRDIVLSRFMFSRTDGDPFGDNGSARNTEYLRISSRRVKRGRTAGTLRSVGLNGREHRFSVRAVAVRRRTEKRDRRDRLKRRGLRFERAVFAGAPVRRRDISVRDLSDQRVCLRKAGGRTSARRA